MSAERRRCPWLVVGVIVAALPLAACRQAGAAEEGHEKEGPAKVEKIEGTELSRLTLTEKAVERLDIQTDEVRESQVTVAGKPVPRKIIPFAAVLYDSTGATWVYTNPEPRVYIRHKITIDSIEGDDAILSDGPDVGVKVVTIGASLLFGTEFEFEEG